MDFFPSAGITRNRFKRSVHSPVARTLSAWFVQAPANYYFMEVNVYLLSDFVKNERVYSSGCLGMRYTHAEAPLEMQVTSSILKFLPVAQAMASSKTPRVA